MHKLKIVFYGNCQLAVLSRMFQMQTINFNDKYEVLKASDYNLASIWNDDIGVVAPFLYTKNTKYGQASPEVFNSVTKIMDDADIIIFQNFRDYHNEVGVPELKSDHIYSKYCNSKIMLCVPGFWFSGYMMSTSHVFPYIFVWLLENGLTACDILHWLKYKSDQKITTLLELHAKISLNELTRRKEEDFSLYKSCIDLLPYIKNYKQTLLCCTHNHPTDEYFKILYEQVSCKLGMDLSIDLNTKIIKPTGKYPVLSELCFFRENFPNIIGCIDTDYSYRVNADFVNSQVDICKALQDHEMAPYANCMNILRS